MIRAIREFFLVCCVLSMGYGLFGDSADILRGDKLFAEGNFKEAYAVYERIATSAESADADVVNSLNKGVAALRRLAMVKDADGLLERALGVHGGSFRVCFAAARIYMSLEHFGVIIGGEFERGSHRGGGRMVNSFQRDRVRVLQLYERAFEVSGTAGASAVERYDVVNSFAGALLYNMGYSEAWRLQYLTETAELPDYDEGHGLYYFRHGDVKGAPVGADGKPVYYGLVANFADSCNDGERWRWLLAKGAELVPAKALETKMQFGQFLHQQFGVQTMAAGPSPFGGAGDFEKDESGPFAVHSLKDDETIARLATGIRRFELPQEYSFIKIFREIADSDDKSHAEEALRTLSVIYSNRRQYLQAAEVLRESILRFGPGQRNRTADALSQIVGNLGSFSPKGVQAHGMDVSVAFRYRNARSVKFEAFPIDVRRLLSDIREYLKSDPAKLDWNRLDLNGIGYRIINDNMSKYIGERSAEWGMELDPSAEHYDREVTVKMPLSEAGAYLVTSQLPEGAVGRAGNVGRIVVWVTDTVIVNKNISGEDLYFVADALTGMPVAKAEVDFFGYKQVNPLGRDFKISTIERKLETADNGLAILTSDFLGKESGGMNWLVTARTGEGRFAYLGFKGVWFGMRHDDWHDASKSFLMTDRPVYRPSQKVSFKFWTARARYDEGEVSQFANRVFRVFIHDPKGEKVLEMSYTADEFGGINGEYELPVDAALGTYNIFIESFGGGYFRVEEYKKPEYEVLVEPPSEPAALGDVITASIKARYYFGAPVTNARVTYKVHRTEHSERWFPIGIWDWLYGPGYWWFAPDYEWFPGWREWGFRAPFPWWMHRVSDPPELVMENEVQIGDDGVVKIEIDTSLAKAVMNDRDHRYEITAEVVDQSRRTIVGKGSVIAARRPFSVNCWVDRGYYRVGDTVSANFAARTVDGKGVQGKGALRLMKVGYDAKGEISEEEVSSWALDTDDAGFASFKLNASRPGQYRLVFKVTDSKGVSIEGGYVFMVRGADPDWKAAGGDFRFNAIEVLNDRKDYRPGEKANLLINTAREDSCVLFFVRAVNGMYLAPKVLKLKGKSAFESVDVELRDMPNFFVEALTVEGGRIHTAVREIIVPPESRVLNVEVDSVKERYKPGEKAVVKLRLTDIAGRPVKSSVAVTVYDKSVEYISGGSNVPDIKEFFWKWRRNHNVQTASNLSAIFGNVLKRGETRMGRLGVFGDMLDEDAEAEGGVLNGFAAGRGEVRRAKGAVPSAPMAMMAVAADSVVAVAEAAVDVQDMGSSEDESFGEGVHVRSSFADTAYWSAGLVPGADGTVEIELDMPENLTTWKIKAWAMSGGTRVGQGETEVITSKELIIRLQSPRFFVEKDEAVLSAVVHNYHESAKDAKVSLMLKGGILEFVDKGSASRPASIPSGGEVRVDWRVRAVKEGEAKIAMAAVTGDDSDAMEMSFPVYVHGISKQVPFSGCIPSDSADGVAKFAIDVPRERRIEETVLELRYSPTLAGAIVDALPYLVSYPYGCTEQMLNRFVPTAIVGKVLEGMGLDMAAVREKRTNLNAQEIGDDEARAAQWKRRAIIIGHDAEGKPVYTDNPVFDEAVVKDMVAEGVRRLQAMQVSDGGWGWFSGWGERSYPHTTCVVVHGLQAAGEFGVEIPPDMVSRGVEWLKAYLQGETAKLDNHPKKKDPYKASADNIDSLVYMVLADDGMGESELGRMRGYLYRDRNNLSVYAKATLGLGLHRESLSAVGAAKASLVEMRDMVIRNIEQHLVVDEENQTAYLNLGNDGFWWRWYGSEYEAMAYYLKLLSHTDPMGRNASWLAKYLVNNRKHATYWNSTRDTALCVEALSAFIVASGESAPDMTVEILLDGKVVKSERIGKDNLFSFDNRLVLSGAEVPEGRREVEVRRRGTGPVYFNSYLSYFSLEDFIGRAGLEIRVDRAYYKLERDDKSVKVQGDRGQALDQKVERYKRIPLANLATVISGDLVEIELLIESKNDYEYIVFEDMKAAGFEPVDLRSGYTGNEMGAYVEFRDEKVCFFVRSLARGKHSMSYRMRAEIPGKFSALPTTAAAMYAPELRGNSDEIKLEIIEKE